jgi:hypothetical protein
MSDSELHGTVRPSRRGFMRLVGATTAATAVGVGSLGSSSQPARAFTNNYWLNDSLIDAGEAAIGWALREGYQALASDAPPEGLTKSALKQDVFETVQTRQSTNASDFMDNRNILVGIEHAAYIEGKLPAFEALNNGKSQSETQSAMLAPVDAYETTIKKNLLKTWNESVNELEKLSTTIANHPDAGWNDAGFLELAWSGSTYPNESGTGRSVTFSSTDVTLPDGSPFTVRVINTTTGGADNVSWQPTEITGDSDIWVRSLYDTDVEYLIYSQWNSLYADITTAFEDVSNGLINWLDGVYGQVQSGAIEVQDLITPRERAAMMTDDGKYPQAVADLLALNVPVDLEREAKVTLDYTNGNVTLSGSLAITSPPSTLTTGSYDPSADNLGSVYLTYDVSEGVGIYQSYDDTKGVDGGVVEFEAQPPSPVTFKVYTNYDEVAEFPTSDLTKGTDGSGNTVWTVDVSGQLDNPIAQIEKVEYVSQTTEAEYETIHITGPFTIESFTNTETGESADSADFESSEPQDDSNYVTQQEWDDLVAQNKRLIEKYEDSQTDGSSGGGGSSSSGFLSGEWMGVPKAGWLLGGSGISLLGYELVSDDDDHRRRGGGRY